MDDFISKPVNPQALIDVIEKWAVKPEARQEDKTIDKVESQDTKRDVFDKAELFNRLMDDEDLAKEVIELFLDDIPPKLIAIKEAFAKGDMPLLQRLAHTVKGAAANIGAGAFRHCASRMEQAGEAGDIDKSASLLPQMDAQFEKLKSALALSGLTGTG